MNPSGLDNIRCSYIEDVNTFKIQQEGYPEFFVNEGYLQRLVDAFLDPTEIVPDESLWETFVVTESKQSLILERSLKGKVVVVLRLSKVEAKEWAHKIDETFRSVIRSYVW